MSESFRLGGEAIRLLVYDPLLPEPIVAPGERRALVEAMRRYDRLGRQAWAGWLGDDIAYTPPRVRRSMAADSEIKVNSGTSRKPKFAGAVCVPTAISLSAVIHAFRRAPQSTHRVLRRSSRTVWDCPSEQRCRMFRSNRIRYWAGLQGRSFRGS